MPANNLAKPNTITNLSEIKFARRSFLLMGSSILRLFVQLAIIFIYSRYLSHKDYGIYQSVWLYMNIISIISLFGLPSLILSASVKNIREWISENKKLFIVTAALLNFVPLLYLLFAVTIYDYPTRLLLIIVTIVQNITIIIEAIVIKKEKESQVLYVNILHTIGYFLCHIILIFTHYSLQILLAGLIFTFIVKCFLLWHINKSQANDKVNVPVVQLGRQWFYLGIYDVLGVLSKWFDKWVILFFVSATQFAIYFNGAYEIPVFGLILGAVGNVMLVELSKHQNNVFVKAKTLFENSALLLSSIVFPSFCFLLFYYEEFFIFIFSSKYQESIPIFLISIFILPARIINSTVVLQVYHKSNLIAKGAALDLLIALILAIIFFPFFHMRGFALAFVISTYIQLSYYLWHTSKLLNKSIRYFFPFKKLFVYALISALTTGATYYLFKNLVYPTNMIVGIAVCILLIIILLLHYYKRSAK